MTAATETKTLPRLKQKYRSEVIASLQEQYNTQPDAGSGPREGRREHGCRRGCRDAKADRRRAFAT